MNKELKSYNIKVNRMEGLGFEFIGTEYLNVFDSDNKKDKNIKIIKEKYNIKDNECINISNFFNVYC